MDVSVASFISNRIESKISEGSTNALVKVKNEAISLLSELKNVNERLASAESRGEPSTSHEVSTWVKEVRQIAYDVEDEVDNLMSKSSFLSINLGAHQASKKLRGLKKRASLVNTELDVQAEGSTSSNEDLNSPARSYQSPKGHVPAADDHVIGINHEIERIVGQLTRKMDSSDGQPRVDRLAIVGMGGSGKTTLARSIYNHNTVKTHFNFQAWVSVSRGWDKINVLDDMLKQIRGPKTRLSVSNNDELTTPDVRMITEPNKILYEKTCLLVFDDVWDLKSLHEFIGSIQGDGNNYTIVTTSRQTPMIDLNSWCIHQPKSLTDEECWKLFSSVANNSSKALTVQHRTLAMEMLKKCKGLPLAIVALGRLLKTKLTMNEWQQVLNQMDGLSMYGPVNEILGLSYDQLPRYLKPCFLYLGLFPEGSTISGGTLVRMWIAEGFIENEHLFDSKGAKVTVEVAGRKYLQELIDHTMVQVVKRTYRGKAKFIRIHDIMRDFCILKAKEQDFLEISSFENEAIGKASRRVAINLSKSLILPADSPHLRSLTIFGQSSTTGVPDRYSNQVNQSCINLDNLCQMYKFLRVLDIVGIKTPNGTLPTDIGKLVHLTYLRIRSTNIRTLPKSIGKLRNLLTLDYWDVRIDTEVYVPNELWKLEKLRHLYLPNEMGGSVEALQLDTLKDLIILWGVGGGVWMLNEMSKLISTLNKLYIHRISTEKQLEAVLTCPSVATNSRLYALTLEWYGFEAKNLEALLSKGSLQKLRLNGKAPDESYLHGLRFPSSLEKLELYYTRLEKSETMSLLGKLGFLKVLRLAKDSYVGSEWTCNKDAFPLLEELKLTNLPNLEKWEIEEESMCNLKKLSIVSCIVLKRMPEGLKLVQGLENLNIERMPCTFISRLQKAKEERKANGEDFHIIEHIPQVVIRDSRVPLVY